MTRLLIEDVTLLKGPPVTAHVRFRGGASTTLELPPALAAWQLRQTSPQVVVEIDTLLDHHTDSAIAARLNECGYTSGTGQPFRAWIIWRLRREYKLRSRYDRLRAAGMLDQSQMAKRLHVAPATVKLWRRAGLLQAHVYNDKGQCLFEPPGPDHPVRYKRKPALRTLRHVKTTQPRIALDSNG